MTKSTNHGGARAGAGRKPKPPAESVPVPVAQSGLSASDLAKHFAAMAIETLAVIAGDGSQPASARVAASREILDRSEGKPKPGTAPKTDQPDMFADDGWDELLTPSRPAAGRSN